MHYDDDRDLAYSEDVLHADRLRQALGGYVEPHDSDSPTRRQYIAWSRYLLHYRELAGRALALTPLHNDDRGEIEDLLYRAGSRDPAKRLRGASRLEWVDRLVRFDREIIGQLRAASRANADGEAWARRLLPHVRSAARTLEGWLGAPPSLGDMPVWDRRGPDLAPRRRREYTPAPPKPSKEEKAAARAAERLDRVVALLKKHPAGLSKNGIFQKLRAGKGRGMGRLELSRALEAGESAGTIIAKGMGESLADPRYCVRPGLSEKSRSKSPAMKVRG